MLKRAYMLNKRIGPPMCGEAALERVIMLGFCDERIPEDEESDGKSRAATKLILPLKT